MFKIDGNQLFTWYNIFLVLGLDKSFPFLFDIGFPLPDYYWQIQPIARDFVEKMFAIEGQLYEKGQPSAKSVQLYQNLHATLIERVGAENTQTLCEWGNKLNLDNTRLEDQLFLFESNLTRAFREDEKNNPNDPNMLPVKMLIRRNWHRGHDIQDAIDEMELLPRNTWEESAYTLYFRIGADRRKPEPLLSPMVFLWAIVNYLSDMRLVMQLRSIPNIEALLTRLGMLEMYTELNVAIESSIVDC